MLFYWHPASIKHGGTDNCLAVSQRSYSSFLGICKYLTSIDSSSQIDLFHLVYESTGTKQLPAGKKALSTPALLI